jgi:hypothetical protein
LASIGRRDDGRGVAGAIAAETDALKGFAARLIGIDPKSLSLDAQLDREQLIHAMDAGILANAVIRQWARDPDFYSSGVTSAAYVIMKRKFAPAADRLKSLVEREKKMPAVLDEGRTNLTAPAKIFTEVAIEQIDGNIAFFKNDVTAAFADVTDKALLRVAQTNAGVAARSPLTRLFCGERLPRPRDPACSGVEVTRKLYANEMMSRRWTSSKTPKPTGCGAREAFQATAEIDAGKSADGPHVNRAEHRSPQTCSRRRRRARLDPAVHRREADPDHSAEYPATA